ncbi:unnamed protein product [Paramecium sonneborni]|uniref:Uncharacterized protein n=1 Tax=Paramecium sonneborni TaxID=65129 RepID=A0A8S1QVW9_9CILI|nr:unnamed protein product [Paramecium sonneborni]
MNQDYKNKWIIENQISIYNKQKHFILDYPLLIGGLNRTKVLYQLEHNLLQDRNHEQRINFSNQFSYIFISYLKFCDNSIYYLLQSLRRRESLFKFLFIIKQNIIKINLQHNKAF